MDPIWAEEVLRDRGSELTAASLRDLTMLATGDQCLADRAFSERSLAILNQKRDAESGGG